LAVCGAIRWPDKEFRRACQPKSVTTALFLAFLKKLKRRASQRRKKIVLVLENGTCFTSKRSTAAIAANRSWLEVYWRPRYSSEKLNWSERVWKHIEEDYFSRMLVKNPKQFITVAKRLIESFEKKNGLLQALKPRKSIH
jgi:transposase